MSGGSYRYAHLQLEDLATALEEQRTLDGDKTKTTSEAEEMRAIFARLLKRVADAMHAIERVDSYDYGPGDEVNEIRGVFQFAALVADRMEIEEEVDDPEGGNKE